MKTQTVLILTLTVLAFAVSVTAQKPVNEQTVAGQDSQMSHKEFFGKLIAFNTMTHLFQSSWIDDFHMNYAILFSQGESIERGFMVHSEYDVGDDQPKWGWRTEYVLIDDDHRTAS